MSGEIRNKPYDSVDAHKDYMFKRALSKGEYKLKKHPIMTTYIKNKMSNDKWSPDVIVDLLL